MTAADTTRDLADRILLLLDWNPPMGMTYTQIVPLGTTGSLSDITTDELLIVATTISRMCEAGLIVARRDGVSNVEGKPPYVRYYITGLGRQAAKDVRG